MERAKLAMNGDDMPGMFVYGAIEPAKGFIVIIERDEDACDLLAGDITPVCFVDQLLQHALCFSDPTEPGISDRQPCVRLMRPLLRLQVQGERILELSLFSINASQRGLLVIVTWIEGQCSLCSADRIVQPVRIEKHNRLIVAGDGRKRVKTLRLV